MGLQFENLVVDNAPDLVPFLGLGSAGRAVPGLARAAVRCCKTAFSA